MQPGLSCGGFNEIVNPILGFKAPQPDQSAAEQNHSAAEPKHSAVTQCSGGYYSETHPPDQNEIELDKDLGETDRKKWWYDPSRLSNLGFDTTWLINNDTEIMGDIVEDLTNKFKSVPQAFAEMQKFYEELVPHNEWWYPDYKVSYYAFLKILGRKDEGVDSSIFRIFAFMDREAVGVITLEDIELAMGNQH